MVTLKTHILQMKKTGFRFLSTFVLMILLTTYSCVAQAKGDISWKTVNNVEMPIPPKVHPRLCLRSEEYS